MSFSPLTTICTLKLVRLDFPKQKIKTSKSNRNSQLSKHKIPSQILNILCTTPRFKQSQFNQALLMLESITRLLKHQKRLPQKADKLNRIIIIKNKELIFKVLLWWKSRRLFLNRNTIPTINSLLLILDLIFLSKIMNR